MLKRYYVVTLLIFISLQTYSQQAKDIILPDSIGRYLYELFVNRANIDQPELNISTDYLLSDSVSVEMEIPMSSNSIENGWGSLLEYADQYKLTQSTVKYYNTFFNGNIRSNGDVTNYSLYIAMMDQKNSIIAFNVDLIWDDTKWKIIQVSPNLYELSQTFEPTYFNFTVIEDTNQPSFDYNPYSFNSSYMTSGHIKNNTLPSLMDVSNDIIQSILLENSIKDDRNIPTQSEYMEYTGEKLLEELKLYYEEESSNKDELKTILDYPELLYMYEIVENRQVLIQNLKNEFNISNLNDLNRNEVTMEITNWDSKFGLHPVEGTVRALFSHNNIDAGIIFTISLYKNKWKVNGVQAFPFSISSAVSSSSVDDASY